MSWKHPKFKENGSLTPNGTKCRHCGWGAGEHWGKESMRCPTDLGSADRLPRKRGYPKPLREKKPRTARSRFLRHESEQPGAEDLRYVRRILNQELADRAEKGEEAQKRLTELELKVEKFAQKNYEIVEAKRDANDAFHALVRGTHAARRHFERQRERIQQCRRERGF